MRKLSGSGLKDGISALLQAAGISGRVKCFVQVNKQFVHFFFPVKFGRVNSIMFYTIYCSAAYTLPFKVKFELPK